MQENTVELQQRYLTSVLLELAVAAEPLRGEIVTSVFFGGGTPSLLPVAMAGRILNEASRYFHFSSDVEITFEANPESFLYKNWAEDVHCLGVNRISLGTQSFCDEELQLLGRAHTVTETVLAVETARKIGFSNINLDLMWGLPAKEPRNHKKHWIAMLRKAVALAPEHLSTYSLMIEDGTNFCSWLKEGGLYLPDEREERTMFFEGISFLESKGFLQYEISNFSHKGFACQHNIGYWRGEPYLGLGPSAVSTLGNIRKTNPSDFFLWEKNITNTTEAEIENLSLKTLRMEHMMLGLRTVQGINLSLWKSIGGGDVLSLPLVKMLIEEGLAGIATMYFYLTRKGLMVSNSIIKRLFEEELLFGKETETLTKEL